MQLFLNEFNYRDGTIHQHTAPRPAPNSSVAAEKQFGSSRSSSLCLPSRASSQETSRIYVCEARDDRSSVLRSGGFSFGRGAKRLDGSRAKTNFFILYAVQTDSVQLPLYRTVFRVTPWLFPQLHFLRRCKRCQQRPGPVPHYASLFSVSAAVVVAVSRSDTTAKLTYCHTK